MDSLVGMNVVGSRVKVIEYGLEFSGKVKTFEQDRGSLGLILDTGGLQMFYRRDVESVTILDEKVDDIEIDLKKLGLASRNDRHQDTICYRCQLPGHLAMECKNEENATGGIVCYRCDLTGHFARDCKKARDPGGIECYRCQQPGHFARDCTGSKVQEVPVEKAVLTEDQMKNKAVLTEDQMKNIFNELRPDRPSPMCLRGLKSTKNPHLNNLHRINMDELLGKGPEVEEEELPVFPDSKGWDHFQLPAPTVSSQARLDVNGHVLNGGFTQRIIRKLLWSDQDTPPHLDTPQWLYIVGEVGDLFEEAVGRVRDQPLVGLSLQGVKLGRAGELCWLSLATHKDVFMFDILNMGEEAFKFGLRSVLQDPRIIKVMHDSRQPADCLTHQCDVHLTRVWDTLAGDIVFCNQKVFDGFLPRYARCQGNLLKDYLGVEDRDIFYPRYRRTHIAEDSAVWKQRPLPSHLLLGAARAVLYLPALYKTVRRATLLPFNQVVAILNVCVREKDDLEAEGLAFETSTLPVRVGGALPTWEQDRQKMEERGLFLDGDFIHQTVGNPDPLLIFSKDSMHQGTPMKPQFVPFKPPPDI